ncbi:S-4TM family putative pore-forming effector [Sphingobium amiense]|uniref:S-4TM family putative pore-forming effector n=1 Tax=Sphingobium amiense TaxID=135719 RepID=UPI00350E4592
MILRDAFRQRDAADAQKLARAEAEALWELALAGGCDDSECERQSRKFQNSIFQCRTSNPLLLPFVYRWLPSGMEIDIRLGSGLVDQSQKMTVAARAMAEKKALGHRS